MAYEKKILMVVCDGMGDRPVKELGRKTPLEFAKTPNLDWFTKNGAGGIMDSIKQGVTPGSDTAHMALLGYDPYELYVGRGPFEAAGSGMDLNIGDIAFRCNFSTLDNDFNVTDRRAGRIKSGTDRLAEALKGITVEDIEFVFQETQEHRGVLKMMGPDLSPAITDVDPHKLGKVHTCEALKPEAHKTARVLNQYVKIAHDLLKHHPVNKEREEQGLPAANSILPRGAGVTLMLQSLETRYGVKAGCIAGVALVKGVFKMCNAELIDVPGATGGANTDVHAKLKTAVKSLDNHDFMFVNVKAPDLFGHDGDHEGKVKCIENIDDAFGYVKDNLPEDAYLAVTADHSTPVSVMDHSADPVPLMMYGEGCRVDPIEHFGEGHLAMGSLNRIQGKYLLPIMMDLANRREKFGA